VGGGKEAKGGGKQEKTQTKKDPHNPECPKKCVGKPKTGQQVRRGRRTKKGKKKKMVKKGDGEGKGTDYKQAWGNDEVTPPHGLCVGANQGGNTKNYPTPALPLKTHTPLGTAMRGHGGGLKQKPASQRAQTEWDKTSHGGGKGQDGKMKPFGGQTNLQWGMQKTVECRWEGGQRS